MSLIHTETPHLTQAGLNKTVWRHRQAFRKVNIVLPFAHLPTRQPGGSGYLNAQARRKLGKKYLKNLF